MSGNSQQLDKFVRIWVVRRRPTQYQFLILRLLAQKPKWTLYAYKIQGILDIPYRTATSILEVLESEGFVISKDEELDSVRIDVPELRRLPRKQFNAIQLKRPSRLLYALTHAGEVYLEAEMERREQENVR